MKNMVQKGDVLTLAAPYDVAAGACAKIGDIIGVAVATLLSGISGEFQLVGVFDLLKLTADVVAVGDKLYWDDTNKYLTTTATSNTLAGVATVAAGSSATTVYCRLNPAS